jgi:hypothetical protein
MDSATNPIGSVVLWGHSKGTGLASRSGEEHNFNKYTSIPTIGIFYDVTPLKVQPIPVQDADLL